MAVPDRDDLTDCQEELHRLVRQLTARERYINDLEQHITTVVSFLHRTHVSSTSATFPYCSRQVCKHTAELLGMEPSVKVKP